MQANIGIVFPGQGSQKIGMLSELAKNFSIIQETFTQASHVLDYDLWQLIQEGPIIKLNQTEFTQPALLATEYALWRVFNKCFAIKPRFLAGHSIGEYTAHVCAEVFSFEDTLKLVQLRGKLMQEAAPLGVGAMAAIAGLSDEHVSHLCEEISNLSPKKVYPANFNAIGQVVVAGHTEAVHQLIKHAQANKAKLAKLIPVSVPAHSFFMEKASLKLRAALEEIKASTPDTPIIYNVHAKTAKTSYDIKSLLQEQLYRPVMWTATQQLFKNYDISAVIELGPGKVLTDLAKRTIPTMSFYPFYMPEHIEMLNKVLF
jgi:[acyl-carrier-protein] S-malonyltransferase